MPLHFYIARENNVHWADSSANHWLEPIQHMNETSLTAGSNKKESLLW